MQSIHVPRPSRCSHAFRMLLAVLLLGVTGLAAAAQDATQLAFPGAQGWAAHTPGGRGGKIIRVTTLAAEGPGVDFHAKLTRGFQSKLTHPRFG